MACFGPPEYFGGSFWTKARRSPRVRLLSVITEEHAETALEFVAAVDHWTGTVDV
jgi:hypothetical protein